MPPHQKTIRVQYCFLLSFLAILLGTAKSSADAGMARPCIGYNPENGQWGLEGTITVDKSYAAMMCPAGYAFLATTLPPERFFPSGHGLRFGFCCPLPDGSLTTAHEYTAETCPDNTVATGYVESVEPAAGAETPSLGLRCTRIDQTKFSLGPLQSGAVVAVSRSYFRDFFRKLLPTVFGRAAVRVSWSAIPARIRYGLGRATLHEWYPEFCVGASPGSVLVSKLGTSCGAYSFRELQRTSDGIAGNQGSHVACDAIDNLFSANAQCVVSGSSSPG